MLFNCKYYSLILINFDKSFLGLEYFENVVGLEKTLDIFFVVNSLDVVNTTVLLAQDPELSLNVHGFKDLHLNYIRLYLYAAANIREFSFVLPFTAGF